MKALFCGSIKGNAGPSNVNKGIVKCLPGNFFRIKSSNKYLQIIELLCKVCISDIIVLSGISRQAYIACIAAKLLCRKTVYIMHGCAEYETEINQQSNVGDGLKFEKYILEKADLILPVSKKYMLWVNDRYPQYIDKLNYLYNGIDITSCPKISELKKMDGAIVATGADRIIKNNIVIAEAVESMDGTAHLTVCGKIYHGVPTHFMHTQYTGVIPHSQYIRKLQQSQLFVVNSILESFSVSAIEALMCGCSVLISEAAGVTDLLALEETDIIHDPMDKDEIRGKIEYLLEYPNNERILSQLDLEEYSYPNQVKKLEKMCKELLES